MPLLKLLSRDGCIHKVNVDILQCSETIKYYMSDKNKKREYVAVSIDSDILKLIIKWATHHKDDPPVPEEVPNSDVEHNIPEWDAKFLNVDESTLRRLESAADHLNIKGLGKLIFEYTKLRQRSDDE